MLRTRVDNVEEEGFILTGQEVVGGGMVLQRGQLRKTFSATGIDCMSRQGAAGVLGQ